MALTPIGDIGVANLTEQVGGTITWETEADWDNAKTESGIVHENTAGTVYQDATVLRKGYPTENPMFSSGLVHFLPMHEQSGSTANDFSGQNNDGTIGSGVDRPTNGVVGGNAFNFEDQSGDYVEHPSGIVPYTSDIALSVWVYPENNSANTDLRIHDMREDADFIPNINRTANQTYELWDTTENNTGVTATENDWAHYFFYYEASTNDVEVWIDGTSVLTFSFASTSSGQNRIGWALNGNTGADNRPLIGSLCHGMLWSGSGAASVVPGDLYDAVGGESTLTTATKSFNNGVQPNLDSLSYNLNTSGSIILDVTGSPAGTSETVSQTLDGSSSYSLTWNNNHTNFEVTVRMSTSNLEVTPTLNSMSLTA